MSESEEKTQMEAAGFTWDPAHNGHARWTHMKLCVTALREPWMCGQDWDKRRADKIAEAAGLRLFFDLPLGTRFRIRGDLKKNVYVKLDGDRVIRWNGPIKKDPPDIVTSLVQEISRADRETIWHVVELFEPLAELTPRELEELPKSPGMWEALADYHDDQASQAEAMDCIDSSKYHDTRAKDFHARAAAIQRHWENS